MKKRQFPLVLAVLSMALASLASAQSFSFKGPTVTIAGAPFQGERVVRVTHKLDDGTTITNEVRGRIARDSEGRVREEEQRTMEEGKTLPNEPLYVVVLDPVEHIRLKWNSSSKTANKGYLTKLSVTFPLQPRDRPEPGAQPDKVTTEDLGKKTISGLVATGTRTITMVPIGKLGNDHELKSVHDVWFSDDVKLAVLETINDPLTGQSTLEIQGITRTEPDPALFGLPEGYKPFEMPRGGVVGGVLAPPKQ